MQKIWSSVKAPLFSLDDREKQLGLGSKGVSTYFTPNCNQEDAELVNRFFKDIDMEGMNDFKNKYFYIITLMELHQMLEISPFFSTQILALFLLLKDTFDSGIYCQT